MMMEMKKLAVTAFLLFCSLRAAEAAITLADQNIPTTLIMQPAAGPGNQVIAVVECTSDVPGAAISFVFSSTQTLGAPVFGAARAEQDSRTPQRYYIEASATAVGGEILTITITCLENGGNGQSINKAMNFQATIQTPYFTSFQQDLSIQANTAPNTQLFLLQSTTFGSTTPGVFSIHAQNVGDPFGIDATDFVQTTGAVTRGVVYDVLVEVRDTSTTFTSYMVSHITVESVSAPQNIAVSTSDSCSSATVTWSAPASSNVAIQGYTITYRSYSSAGALLATNTQGGISASATSAVISPLPTADYHEFEVAAVTPAGTGDASSPIRLNCPVTTQPPTTQATTQAPNAALGSQPLMGMIALLLATILLLVV